jgi:hypothetical protein
MQAIGGYGKTSLGAGALHGWQVRHLNPVERVLRMAKLPYLAKRVTHMLYPNYAGRSPYNRHYCYKRGVGWVSDIVTLSRPSVKYDVIGGSLKTLAAGELGANGRIEPATVTRITNSNDKANWVARGTTTLSDITDGPFGAGAIRIVGAHIINKDDVYFLATSYTPGVALKVSLYIRRNSGTAAIRLFEPYGTGEWLVSGLPAGQWVRIDSTSAYVTVTTAWAAGGTNGGIIVSCTDEISDLDIAFVNQTESQAYTTTPILAAGAVTTRAADALRIATGIPAGIKTTGGLVVMLRLPYASTVPAADQYHLGLNGSNSKDDGIFLWTDASADTLIAELVSGGVSQGTVDLGAYSADTQYAIALGWSDAGLAGAINGVEKTSTEAVTVPASIDRLEIGRGISTDTAHGGETPLVMLFNTLPSLSERAGLSGATLKAGAFSGL